MVIGRKGKRDETGTRKRGEEVMIVIRRGRREGKRVRDVGTK
jgi:hypothetical protein